MKRLISGLLALLSLFSLLFLSASALAPPYSVGGAYQNSTYHKNLLSLPRTGDAAFDTVAVALSQLGYHEGNSKADFGGGRASGSGNFTEYNRAFGTIGGSFGYAWCATFASWCLRLAQAGDAAGGAFASCTLWVERLQELGLYRTRASGYEPRAGDLIFFRSAGVSRASDHVGIVRFVKEGRVYTVEGNSSDSVSLREYDLKNTYIVGYGRPAYKQSTMPKSALQMEDNTVGFYTVTNSFLNVRGEPSATSQKRGTLQRGALLQISEIKNGWGRIVYSGKTSYVSLDYADFTSPLLITVSYTADEGSEGVPHSLSYFSYETVCADTQMPKREGYLFLCWRADTGEDFLPGEELPQRDLSLTAIWELAPADEPPAFDHTQQGGAQTPPQDTPTQGEGRPNAPEAEDGPMPPAADTARATVAAGVASGTLACTLFGVWLWQREDLRKRLWQIGKKAK